MATAREQFGSRIGFILAAAGSAVGIGNLVAFPVNAAQNGGGAFLLIYALFVFLVGRTTRKDPLGAYRALSGGERPWLAAGWLSIITPFMIAVFYLVISVWIFGYFVEAATGNLALLAQADTFGRFINSPAIFVYMLVVLAILVTILLGGVSNGIEKAAKILMPALFVMLIALVLFVLTRDNALAGVRFYLVPDMSKVDAGVINSALSQAFFSLSLGMGIMITYGSYIDERANVPGSARLVALTDTAVAFTAGLLVLPAIFSFDPNVDPATLTSSSIGLMFEYLPQVFVALQESIGAVGATLVASTFFLLVFFAAITSLVSIFEVPVAALIDERGSSRRQALMRLGALLLLCSLVCVLSFGMVGFLTEFVSYAGMSKSVFDVVIDVFYDTILPLNGLLICIFAMYRWRRANFNAALEVGSEGLRRSLLERYIDFSLATFIPVVLLLVFISSVSAKFFGVDFLG